MATGTIGIDQFFKAQFGEDRVLWEIFRHRSSGYFIEVGAYDGVSLSNTYFLEQMGWRGLLIEPLLPLCKEAALQRRRSRVVHAACGCADQRGMRTFTLAQKVPVLSFLKADDDHIERCRREGAELVEIEVPVVTLDEILQEIRRNPPVVGGPWLPKVGWSVDLVSIDTEGNELEVLDGFNLDRIKPRILLIENDRPAGGEIEPYLERRGYRKLHRQVINDFYIRKDDPAHDLRLDGLEKIAPR